MTGLSNLEVLGVLNKVPDGSTKNFLQDFLNCFFRESLVKESRSESDRSCGGHLVTSFSGFERKFLMSSYFCISKLSHGATPSGGVLGRGLSTSSSRILWAVDVSLCSFGVVIGGVSNRWIEDTNSEGESGRYCVTVQRMEGCIIQKRFILQK